MLKVPGSPSAAAIVIELFSLFDFVYCFFVCGRGAIEFKWEGLLVFGGKSPHR